MVGLGWEHSQLTYSKWEGKHVGTDSGRRVDVAGDKSLWKLNALLIAFISE